MQGRIAVLKAYGGEFELREYPVPRPEPGAILIKLTRAGVCGSDLHIWRGEMKEIYGPLPRCSAFPTRSPTTSPRRPIALSPRCSTASRARDFGRATPP